MEIFLNEKFLACKRGMDVDAPSGGGSTDDIGHELASNENERKENRDIESYD